MTLAYISLGSNIGDRGEHLRAAVDIVANGDPHRVSSVYETEPWGGVEQDNFWNVVVEVDTPVTARELLRRCHDAENARGRVRDVKFGPRTLDADVLLVGHERVNDVDLVVPHPLMWQRRFVLVPLRELASELVFDDALAGATGDVKRIGTLDTLG